MFERMDISESIYEGVVELSYKRSTQTDANRDGHSRNKRGEASSYKTHPATSESSGKLMKGYLDHLKSKSKTCLIHAPRHSSDKCKVLGELVLSTLKVILLRAMGIIPYKGRI